MGTETGSYGHRGSSGGQQNSAKTLYENRKNYGRNVGTMGEVSQYRVEHLMTFTMDRKEAILTVADSIRKLKILEARKKIWSQELLMMVDDNAVRLIDYQTTEVLEHFPLTQIQDVQSVLNACSYDSICAIVVRESHQIPPDIYLFQCPLVPAQIICADISAALLDTKNKRKRRPETLQKYRDVIDAAHQPPNNQPLNARNKVAEWNVRTHNDMGPMSRADFQPENSMEMMIFKIHRDVDMLNHSLDDIEHFVTLLQKSAAASKELTVRHNGKRQSSHHQSRTPGVGITEVRARLPPKEQFVGVFQKFKLCFNLLAKLRDHIKDPNAVELVHYLFSPLAMIVHTCSGFELPRTIKTPLLQRQTVAFLRNCTSTKEMELLERLGDFWIKSRGEFPKEMYFPPYVPHFLSGWEPPPVPVMEVDERAVAAAALHKAQKARRKEEMRRANEARIEEVLEPISPPPILEKSSKNKQLSRSSSVDSAPKTRKLCRVIHDYNARSSKELDVKKDELLEVLNDTKNWWKVRNNDGGVGYVPEMVLLHVDASESTPKEPKPPSPVPFATPTPIFVPAAKSNPPTPNAAKVLPDIVEVAAAPSPPLTPSAPAPPPAPKPVPISVYTEVKKKKPPVSLPQQTAAPVTAVNHAPSRSAVPVSSTLQVELANRVSGKNQRNFVLPKKKMAVDIVTIDRSSSAAEVRLWLVSLNFSAPTIASLGVLTGGQIFSMTREEVKDTCGDEGSRVYSQLMIQRNMDGYATTNEKSELKEVLKRIRESIPDEEKIEEE